MLSELDNELLTRVGPGTPMGNLLRRYWHPITVASELDENPTKAIRLMGEDLTLYKDRSGNLGLIEDRCPHRKVNMLYGIPEEEGLRCPYHGWLFNQSGQCLEQPYEQAEDPNSNFKDKITIKAYRVEELGGVIFAYMGPAAGAVAAALGPVRHGQRVPGRRGVRHSLQLAADHGELVRPHPRGVAARVLFRLRAGTLGTRYPGDDLDKGPVCGPHLAAQEDWVRYL